MDKKDVKKADRFIQLGLKAAQEAMNDCGLVDENGKVSDEDAKQIWYDFSFRNWWIRYY